MTDGSDCTAGDVIRALFESVYGREDGWTWALHQWRDEALYALTGEEPEIDTRTMYYYNPEGGSHYHADANCRSVSSKYLPMTEKFAVSSLDEAPFSQLTPCSVCIGKLPQSRFESYTDADGQVYELFEVEKLYFTDEGKVGWVYGHYVRIGEGDDGVYPISAAGSEVTYALSDDFSASMLDAPMEFYVSVTNLYDWYTDAYLNGRRPAPDEMTFLCDVPAEQRDETSVDFWFITTRISRNADGEIEYMQGEYVPWG